MLPSSRFKVDRRKSRISVLGRRFCSCPSTFLFNGEEVYLSENPYSETFFSYQEVQLMNELGTVALEDIEYDIEEIKYCIDECGVRYVEIILS